MVPKGISFDQLRDKINDILNPGGRPWNRYVREIYEDRVIFEDDSEGSELYEAPYTVTEDGEVSLGEARKVRMIYVAAKNVEGAPAEVQVIPYGLTTTDKGDFVLSELEMAAVIADFEARKNDMVIDFEHQTLSGDEAPAAGWIKKLISKGYDGLWAAVEWTPRAREYLKNREYRYLSPVFLKRISDNRVVRLLGAGLTNTPAIDGMVPLVNKFRGGDGGTSAVEGLTSKNEKEVKVMKKLLKLLGLKEDATEDQAVEAVQKVQARAGLGEKAIAALELKDGATDTDVETAVVALKEGAAGIPKEITAALELKDGTSVSEAVGTIEAMKAGHGQTEDLGKKVKDLETKLAKKDAGEAVALAMSEGKITPAQEKWASEYAERDLEGFKAFVAKAPVVVKTGEHAKGPGPGGGEIPDEVQLSVNKMCGVSAETFKKHNTEKKED